MSGTVTATAFSGSGSAALDFQVNGLRALRLEPHATSPNVVGGHSTNIVTNGVYGATISGGGDVIGNVNLVTDNGGTVGGGGSNQAGNNDATIDNSVNATVAGGYGNTARNDFSTVGGGMSNMASGTYATVGGGTSNNASGINAFVGGGDGNTASNSNATVAGGFNNSANAAYATIGGGSGNYASQYATVPGGVSNTAGGFTSFAAGRQAKADHDGTFVWADGTVADFTSTAADQFLIRASGGVGIGTASPGEALDVAGKIKSENTRTSLTANDQITTTSTNWVDMPSLSLTIETGALPVLVMANIHGTSHSITTGSVYFRLLIDGSFMGDFAQQKFNSDVKNVTLTYLGTFTEGNHTIKVQWSTDSGTANACVGSTFRHLLVWE